MNLSSRTEIHKPALFSEQGMVVAQNARAAQIGAEILSAGGNAADAAVAVSFALGVVEPWMSGVGGGGAALFRDAASGVVYSIDFGLRAPLELVPGAFVLADGISQELFPWRRVVGDRNACGIHSVAVPATVAGMAALHARFGRMPWAELIAPAIEEARRGFLVDWFSSLAIGANTARLTADPAMAEQFLPDGVPPSTIDMGKARRLPMMQLAETLEAIAAGGAHAFYKGDIATALVQEFADLGGSIGKADLSAMSVDIIEASSTRFRQADVFLAPGLTAGRTLGRTLSLLAGSDGARPQSSMRDWYVAIADALQTAQAERWEQDGDTQHPDCTSHFSTCDAAGNLCSVTQTILSAFGSGVMTPKTGVILNNGMLWFDPEPGRPNSLGPGKRCLMNVCPTIVRQKDRFTAIGAAGGRRILSAVAQLVGFVVDHGMSIEEATHHPRIDCSSAGTIQIHPGLVDTLANAFPGKETFSVPHTVWPIAYSIVGALAVEPDGAIGCADPISPGADAAVSDG